MGRSIPSLRQLIEIERLNWSLFKKRLKNKEDKQAFDSIFENARLYAPYLSNACNPIPIESIFMGGLFHNYKTLFQINDKDKDQNDKYFSDIEAELKSLVEEPQGKILFDRVYKKWKGFIESLHKDDRILLLRIIIDICNYNECLNSIININPEPWYNYLFFLNIVLQQQKIIKSINQEYDINRSNTKKDTTLWDFI